MTATVVEDIAVAVMDIMDIMDTVDATMESIASGYTAHSCGKKLTKLANTAEYTELKTRI